MDEARVLEDRQVARQRGSRHVDLRGDLADGHAARPGLHPQPVLCLSRLPPETCARVLLLPLPRADPCFIATL